MRQQDLQRTENNGRTLCMPHTLNWRMALDDNDMIVNDIRFQN